MLTKSWNNCRNVLCIRPDNMGDVIMTTPAFRVLKDSFPEMKLSLLTSKSGAVVTELIPEIDEVIVADLPWLKHSAEPEKETASNLISVLQEKYFDGAIIFTNFSQSPLPTATLCYLAGIPRVAGLCRENPYHLLTDWIPDHDGFDKVTHGVARQLQLVESLGASGIDTSLRLEIPDSAYDSLQQKLRVKKVSEKNPWIALHIGASEKKRQADPEIFIAASKRLIAVLGCQVLLTGGAGEAELVNKAQQEIGYGSFSIVDSLSVPELAALIAESQLLISNNTGPVHIAAAVQTPVVVLSALTNAEHTPWKVPHKVLHFDVPPQLRSRNVLLQYHYQHELSNLPKLVSAEDVVSAALELLSPPREKKYYA